MHDPIQIRKTQTLKQEGYRRLAAAVLIQALADARYLHKVLKKNPKELKRATLGRGSAYQRVNHILAGPDPVAWLRRGSIYHELCNVDPAIFTDEILYGGDPLPNLDFNRGQKRRGSQD